MTREERARIKINKNKAEIARLRAVLSELYDYQMRVQEEYMTYYTMSSRDFKKVMNKIDFKKFDCNFRIKELEEKISKLRNKYGIYFDYVNR